jgi:Flp pilus assembly protein TadG
MLRSIRSWSRFFRKKEDGATAVEFALVAMPFIGLTMAILELGIYFLASRFMEDAVFRAGREVMTNQGSTANCGDLVSKVKNQLPTLISSGNNVGGTGAPVASTATGCSMGGPGSIILLTARYDYPFFGFRFTPAGPMIGKDMPITSSTAFRREN